MHVRARRAVDRPAPARQRAPDRDAAAAARPRQHACSSSSTTRRRSRRPTRSSTSARARAATAARSSPRARPTSSRRNPASLTGRYLVGRRAHRGARARAATPHGLDQAAAARASTTCKNVDVDDPARRAGRGDRRVGRGQVVADQRDPAPGARPHAATAARPIASGRTTRSTGLEQIDKVHRHRPEADRPHAALEPGDVHQGVRPDPRAVRADAGGARVRLPARAVLVQRAQGRRAARRARATACARSRCTSCPNVLRHLRGVPAASATTTRRCA